METLARVNFALSMAAGAVGVIVYVAHGQVGHDLTRVYTALFGDGGGE